MRINVCVGKYATIPYCIPGLGINVYCMEEFCYCIRENTFLVDGSIMNDSFLDWIDKECGLRDLVRALYPLVHKMGSLSVFVVTIFQYVGMYDANTIKAMEYLLKEGAGLTSIERKKGQIDYLVFKKKYLAAIREYDELIELWQEYETRGELLPAVDCLAAIIHNKGIALTGLMLYEKAAMAFSKAYELDQRKEYLRDYLAAKRMELSEKDYISFAAGQKDGYELALELERDMERYRQEWEEQPEFLRLNSRRELRESVDKKKYYEDSTVLIQTMKENYRDCVSN